MGEGCEKKRRKQRKKGHGPVIDKMCQKKKKVPNFGTL